MYMRELKWGQGALFLIAVAILMVTACGDSGGSKSQGMPGLPDDLRTKLVETCDFVDIIFYNSPASMNQSDPGSIRRVLGFISENTVETDDSCSPLGRMSLISNGEITAEGDIYISEGCQYIVFMLDNKPAYANGLSEDGIQFFQSILQGIQDQLPTE